MRHSALQVEVYLPTGTMNLLKYLNGCFEVNHLNNKIELKWLIGKDIFKKISKFVYIMMYVSYMAYQYIWDYWRSMIYDTHCHSYFDQANIHGHKVYIRAGWGILNMLFFSL